MGLVERLRNQGEFWPNGLANEAADEIKRLREAFQKMLDLETYYGPYDCLEIARDALKGTDNEN